MPLSKLIAVSISHPKLVKTTQAYEERYKKIRKELETIQENEKNLGVDDSARTIFTFQKKPDQANSIFFLHGYTCGNWQFNDMSRHFYRLGYNVILFNLPGHGIGTSKHLAYSTETQKLESFITARFSIMSAFKNDKHLVGFSAGGLLSTYIRVKHPHTFTSVTLLAPYFLPTDIKGLIGFTVFRLLEKHLSQAIPRILDFVPYSLKPRNNGVLSSNEPPKYPVISDTRLGHFYVLSKFFFDFLSTLTKSQKGSKILAILTDCDRVASPIIAKMVLSCFSNITFKLFSQKENLPHSFFDASVKNNDLGIEETLDLMEKHFKNTEEKKALLVQLLCLYHLKKIIHYPNQKR